MEKFNFDKIDKKYKAKIFGSKSLSMILDKVNRPILKKRGFFQAKIINHWDEIIGKEFAPYCTPKKLIGKKDNKFSKSILVIEVFDSGIAMQLSYMEMVIIEKLIIYFGYKIVDKIKIVQNPKSIVNSKQPTAKIVKKPPSDENKEKIAYMLKDIEDDKLKEALKSIGYSIFSEDIIRIE